ncbi:Protein SERAC1, partial [Lachnellula suecica]
GSAIDLKDIKQYELTEVYAHPDAKVDIVLVHGLNGNPRKTWTSEKGVFWPTDLLPATLKSAKARILVYGYNADVYAFGKAGASSDMLHQHAQTLLANLSAERQIEETTDHPIIWVVHSLGGLLLKRALNLSDDLESKYADELRSIAVSTYGIIFLGTPHTGADPAKWGIMVEKMVSALIPKKIVHTEAQLVKTLQTNNETLQNVNLKFLEIQDRYRIDLVHESIPTDLGGTKTLIVDQISASPAMAHAEKYGIEATHSGMCKFDSKSSPGYSMVAGHIKGWVEKSPPVIQARQEEERQKRLQDLEKARKDLQWGYHPPQAPTGANTPGTSHGNQQGFRQPGMVEAPPPRTRFEFEVAEVEEMDTEMAGGR